MHNLSSLLRIFFIITFYVDHLYFNWASLFELIQFYLIIIFILQWILIYIIKFFLILFSSVVKKLNIKKYWKKNIQIKNILNKSSYK